MRSFKDNEGREWVVAVNVTGIKRCRGLLKIDLLGLLDDKLEGLSRFLSDPIALVDVVYVLCKDQADGRGVSDEDFGRAMAGDAIARASAAFVEEYADFSQDPRLREMIRAVIAKARAMEDRVREYQTTRLAEIDPEAMASEAIEQLRKASGRATTPAATRGEGAGGPGESGPARSNGRSGDSPGSSESTPAPSPSANSP